MTSQGAATLHDSWVFSDYCRALAVTPYRWQDFSLLPRQRMKHPWIVTNHFPRQNSAVEFSVATAQVEVEKEHDRVQSRR